MPSARYGWQPSPRRLAPASLGPFENTGSSRDKTLGPCYGVHIVRCRNTVWTTTPFSKRGRTSSTQGTLDRAQEGHTWEADRARRLQEAMAEMTVRPPTQVIWLAPRTVPSSDSAHGASGCVGSREQSCLV